MEKMPALLIRTCRGHVEHFKLMQTFQQILAKEDLTPPLLYQEGQPSQSIPFAICFAISRYSAAQRTATTL